MNSNFNDHDLLDHDLRTDDSIISLYTAYLKDYPNELPDITDEYSVHCYIEEYEENGKSCARFRDKETNREIVFWTSPRDTAAIEQENDLLEFLSQTKKMNNREFYKKDGTDCILIQAILLSESSDTIEVASYFVELFYAHTGENPEEPMYMKWI